MKPNGFKQVKNRKIDLSKFEFVEIWDSDEEWYKWSEPGQSIAGWITEITFETFSGDRKGQVCHMLIDYENDVQLDTYKNIKFVTSVDLQKRLDKVIEHILGAFSDYKIYIKLDEIKVIGENKQLKVFQVAYAREDMPVDDDDVEF